MGLKGYNTQMVAYEIAEFLKKECPVFDQRKKMGQPYGEDGSVWHGCYCKITGDCCICVWRIEDTCHQGKWDMPFLKELYEIEKRGRAIARKLMIKTNPPKLTKSVKSE